MIQYMMAELGTSGTLDGQQRLIIKGRFLPKVFEGVLRHYFIDYVICNLCKSANTSLDRDKATRLSICKCNACGASRSVSAIQKGFQAVQRGERRSRRAKPRDARTHRAAFVTARPLSPTKTTFVPSRSVSLPVAYLAARRQCLGS